MLSLQDIITFQLINGHEWPRGVRGRVFVFFIERGEERIIYTGPSERCKEFETNDYTGGYLLTIDMHNLEASFGIVSAEYNWLFAARRPGLRLDMESAREMDWIVTRIVKGVTKKERYSAEFVQRYLSLLFLYLRSLVKEEFKVVSVNRKGQLTKGFFDLLEGAYTSRKTVDYYADKLCVTAKYLTNVIKNESGYPTSYHISRRIVLEAKRMARTRGACLKQIAYELGYDDVAGFSKMFKRVAGVTFTDYKDGLQMEYGKRDIV